MPALIRTYPALQWDGTSSEGGDIPQAIGDHLGFEFGAQGAAAVLVPDGPLTLYVHEQTESEKPTGPRLIEMTAGQWVVFLPGPSVEVATAGDGWQVAD